MHDREWLITPQPNPAAAIQLVCLPYAGAGVAAFAGWLPRLPPSIELVLPQLPGRDARRYEPACRTILEAADGLAAAIQKKTPRPCAFFGYSMGAVIAFETVRLLAGTPHAPSMLIVSARRGPSRPETRTAISHLPLPAFIDEVQRRYGGIPDVVLKDPELRDLLLPILRADLASIEAYRYAPGPMLTCPVMAYGGVDDVHATLDDLAAWRSETTGSFRVRQFAGGHFFLQTARDQLVPTLAADLAATVLSGDERR